MTRYCTQWDYLGDLLRPRLTGSWKYSSRRTTPGDNWTFLNGLLNPFHERYCGWKWWSLSFERCFDDFSFRLILNFEKQFSNFCPAYFLFIIFAKQYFHRMKIKMKFNILKSNLQSFTIQYLKFLLIFFLNFSL